MIDLELQAARAGRWAHFDAQVRIAMVQAEKPCLGGECDERKCARHRRFDALRHVRLTRRWKGVK